MVPLINNPRHLAPSCGFAARAIDQPAPDAYEVLLARLRQEFTSYTVFWELTHVCNLKCVMCYNEPLGEPELTTAECLDVLDQLARSGVLRLIMTGGEILVRHDFFEVATEARRLGFALELKTNATLITPDVAEKIARLAPLQVDVSLLGAHSETFGAIAGGRTVLQRITDAVGLLRERRVRVKLNTLLMDLNIAERAQMADLALSLGVECEQVLKVSPTDSGRDKAAERQLSTAQMREALEGDGAVFVPRPLQPAARTCSVGLSSCLISPYGAVFPCLELRIPAGSLHRQRFADIWRDAAIFAQLRARHTLANLPECGPCALQAFCEGRCAGISWKETGDLFRGHTLACRHAQARYEQLHPGTQAPETPFLRSNRRSRGTRLL